MSTKKTKKNIFSNIMVPKVSTQRKNKNPKKNDLIDSLLKKKEEPKKPVEAPKVKNGGKIIENFHKAIKLTNSDEIILKMLDLKENDIIKFYKNMEQMIGKDLSLQIRNDMSKQLLNSNTVKNKNGVSLSLCPFCTESKSNCVILLCGHLICDKCAKNINRCKFPCPRCKKPIKYIQFISE